LRKQEVIRPLSELFNSFVSADSDLYYLEKETVFSNKFKQEFLFSDEYEYD
jgi:hypothetical protein